jgi:hypothetical protein
MTEQAFFILPALVDGPRHGYGIVGEVTALADGRMDLRSAPCTACSTGSSPTASWSSNAKSRTRGDSADTSG